MSGQTAKDRFIETWASHCGAPKAVFVGQLEQMLAEENERMRQRLTWIYLCATARLGEMNLPKRIDEMTPEEYGIYLAMCVPVGALLACRDWAHEALGDVGECL